MTTYERDIVQIDPEQLTCGKLFEAIVNKDAGYPVAVFVNGTDTEMDEIIERLNNPK